MRIKPFAVGSLMALISGCSGLPDKIEKNVDAADVKVSSLVKEVGHVAPAGVVGNVIPTVEHEDGIWLGKNVVKVGQPSLPSTFYEPVTFDRTVYSLSELAERLTLRSGIPTKVSPDALAIANGSTQAPGGGGAMQQSAPPGGFPSAMGALGAAKPRAPMRITYANGNFKSFLDTVAARFGVYWKYVNNTILFYHTDSRTFQISALPGDSTFSASVNSGASSTGGISSGGGGGGASGGASGGNAGGSGGSGGSGSGSGGVSANNSQSTAIASQLSVYSSIEKAILAMLSTHGKVVASPATGTITVVDTPDSLDRVAEFVESENKSLARQITITVTVLSVTLNNADNYGINWNLVYQGLSTNFGITNTSNNVAGGSSFSAGILDTSKSKFAGSQVIAQALSSQGKVRQETSASVVTLNNQPVPVQVATQTSYLASVQTTNTALVGSSTSLTPGVVTSGFNMSILPHVLNNGTVLLQFSTDISSLTGLPSFSSGGSTIQTPTVNTRNFLQRVSMKSNETLIISGFEQTDDSINRNGVGTPQNAMFGGGLNGSHGKQVIVILITPTTSGS